MGRQHPSAVMNQRESFGLAARIGTAMVMVSLSVIALTSALSLFRFEETYKALVEQRLKLTAGEVARVLSVGLDLGLPVEAQDNIPGLLRQHLSAHPDLAAITVIACDGHLLFGEGEAGGSGPPMRKPSWSAEDAGRLAIGVRVTDAMGGCAANLVVTRAAEPFRQAMASVSRRYLTLGAVAATLTTLAMIAAALVFCRPRPTLRALDDDLDCLMDGDLSKGAAGVAAVDPGEAWEADLLDAYRAARPTLAAAQQARGV